MNIERQVYGPGLDVWRPLRNGLVAEAAGGPLLVALQAASPKSLATDQAFHQAISEVFPGFF